MFHQTYNASWYKTEIGESMFSLVNKVGKIDVNNVISNDPVLTE